MAFRRKPRKRVGSTAPLFWGGPEFSVLYKSITYIFIYIGKIGKICAKTAYPHPLAKDTWKKVKRLQIGGTPFAPCSKIPARFLARKPPTKSVLLTTNTPQFPGDCVRLSNSPTPKMFHENLRDFPRTGSRGRIKISWLPGIRANGEVMTSFSMFNIAIISTRIHIRMVNSG